MLMWKSIILVTVGEPPLPLAEYLRESVFGGMIFATDSKHSMERCG